MTTLLIDIETYSDEKLTECGVYRYVESDAFRVLLFAYSVDYAPARIVDVASGEQIPDDIRRAVSDAAVTKIAHNAAFELTCLSRFFGEQLDETQWEDTMVWAMRLGFPGQLAALGKVLGLEKEKLDTGAALIRFFSVPDKNGRQRLPEAAPDKWEAFKTYCLRDVDSEVEVARKLQGRVEVHAWERRLQSLDYQINRRGVRIDLPFVANAIDFASRNKAELLEEAKRITGLENPNSVAQLKAWIHDLTGLRLESMNKKSLEELNVDFLPRVVRRMLEIRRSLGKTSLAKYDAMSACVCQDQRAHGLTQFYGAAQTGRWAGRLVQLQNLPQNHLASLDYARQLVAEGDYDTFSFLYDDVLGTLSELIRTAFVPSQGNHFVVCDFSAIEARVIAWLAGEKWVLDTFIRGGDIYCATASRMFGVPVEKHGQNAPLRQKGKIATLALGYQGGVGALRAMGGERMGLLEDEMKRIVLLWRDSNKHIVRLWGIVETAAKSVLRSGRPVTINRGITYYIRHGILFAKLPSGRSIAYPRARLVEVDGEEHITYERMNQETHKWERAETYGGKLTENLVQAIARDILAVVLLREQEAGLDVVFHVHDETITDCPVALPQAEVERLFCQPVEWAPGLPLKGAAYTGNYYYKD